MWFLILFTFCSKYFNLRYVFRWLGVIWWPPETINGANIKINMIILHTNWVNWKYRKILRRGCIRRRIWSAETLHPSSAFRRHQIYCTQKTSMSWQLSFSAQREKNHSTSTLLETAKSGFIQEHRLQLKLHAEMNIKRHSLHNPNYFLVGFTSGISFGYPKF